MRLFLLLFVLCIFSVGITACEEPISQVGEESGVETDIESHENPDLPRMAFNYPSLTLAVPFLPQVPPGDWSRTNNCGQASCVMLGGYFNNGAMAPWVIDEENRSMGCPLPNGCPMGPTEITNLLWNFHRLHTTLYYGNRSDDVINEVVNNRRPTIAACMISGGRLVSWGGRAHWALVVGWDQARQELILNDPGTNSGRNIRYSTGAFEASWATQGKKYMPVWR